MTWTTILSGLAGAAALISAIFGGMKIYRDSREAARVSAVDGFNRLVEALEARLLSIEKSLDRAQTRITDLETQADTDQAERQDLRDYITDLQTQADTDQAERQDLRDYITYLQQFIGEHAPEGIKPKPMPASQRRDRR